MVGLLLYVLYFPLRIEAQQGEKTDGTASISKLGCVNLLHPSVWLSNLALK